MLGGARRRRGACGGPSPVADQGALDLVGVESDQYVVDASTSSSPRSPTGASNACSSSIDAALRSTSGPRATASALRCHPRIAGRSAARGA